MKITAEQIDKAVDEIVNKSINILREKVKKCPDTLQALNETFADSRELLEACSASLGFRTIISSHIQMVQTAGMIELNSLLSQTLSTGIEIGLKIAESKAQTDILEEMYREI